MVFLWLENVDIAIQRVAARVRAGGHSIHEETIRRRYYRGIKNPFDLYLPITNSWRIFHASPTIPKEIGRYDEYDGETVFDEVLWKRGENITTDENLCIVHRDEITEADERAVCEALTKHKKAGNYVVTSRDDAVVILKPSDIPV